MFGPGLDWIERNVLADESYNLMGAYTQELKPPSVRGELPGELKTYNIQKRIGRIFFFYGSFNICAVRASFARKWIRF